MKLLSSLDHTNYARWLYLHNRDEASLQQCHPDLYAEFCAGNFVVYKSKHCFSAIPIDQTHEQNNVLVKGSGGAVGLTENSVAFRHWMVAGPEISRILEQFQKIFNKGPTFRSTRGSDSLVTTLEDLGNPFMEMSGDLLIIHTNDVMPQEVVSTVRNIQKLSQEQYDTFVAERLLSCNGPVTNTMLKNKLPRFSTPHPKSVSKDKLKSSRRCVTADATILSNRNIDFLRHSDNKLELFNFLTAEVRKGTYPSKEICVTHGQNVMSVPERNDISNVAPCSQEEADTRISLHDKDSADRGYRKVLATTVDSDVALCIGNINKIDLDEL
ncbi:hypothetical protein Hamer_G019871 [Homarus americanus]|uniref:Uncharacterized protein n=1 Tax=Homarus americanus TaxID=6706 RepID=A0A8J5K0S5_HOMAM|nr:hypothetical protein Hamer_G019871 [Homarus americanus]